MNKNEYIEFLRPYKRALKQITFEIENYIEDININVYSVDSRLKDFNSAIQKSKRINIPIDELQDIAGIRIVVASDIEKQVLVYFFKRKVLIDNMKILLSEQIDKSNGYRAYHIVFEMRGHYTRSVYDANIEIQIMTMFEYSFNIISRNWIYKTNKKTSNDWKIKFKDLSKNLKIMDGTINELYSEMIQTNDSIYSDEPLTPSSYQKIIKLLFDEDINLESSADYTAFIVDKGINTNSKLFTFYNNSEIDDYFKKFELLKEKNPNEVELDWTRRECYNHFALRFPGSKKLLNTILKKYDKD